MKLNNQKGFTLIEIAIVLTIVGLIIGGIWVAASTVFNNNKAQAFNKDLVQIIQSTKTLFAAQGSNVNTTNYDTKSASGAGVFPFDMQGSKYSSTPTNLITPFSTDPTTTTDVKAGADVGSPTTDPTQIAYEFDHLPSSACSLAMTTLGSGSNIANLKIKALYGNGTAVTVPTDGTSVAAGDALKNCSQAGNNNTFEVVFSVL